MNFMERAESIGTTGKTVRREGVVEREGEGEEEAQGRDTETKGPGGPDRRV
jgi:hypothetical protein